MSTTKNIRVTKSETSGYVRLYATAVLRREPRIFIEQQTAVALASLLRDTHFLTARRSGAGWMMHARPYWTAV